MDAPPTSVPEDTVEMRRARWAAAGIVADERLQQRAVIVAFLLGCTFLTVLAMVLYVG
jgi:hypothetical protein